MKKLILSLFLLSSLVQANEVTKFQLDPRGWTNLHWAAYHGDPVVIEVLIKNKADVNAKAKDGKTPLHVYLMTLLSFQRQDNEKIVKLFIKNGADLEAKDINGQTPLEAYLNPGQKSEDSEEGKYTVFIDQE